MNICKYSRDSFQEDFENNLEPLWSDSLVIKDAAGNEVAITDNIRRNYINRLIDYLGGSYNIKGNFSDAVEAIQESMENYLDEPLQLPEEDIEAALNRHSITSRDQLNEDSSSTKLEKDDERTAYKNSFKNIYLTKYFGKCIPAQNYCTKQAIKAIVDSCIISPEYDDSGNIIARHIVVDDKQLNRNIRNIQEQLYQNILKYLRTRFSKNIEKVNNLPQSLYSQDQSVYTGGFERLNEEFGDVLNPDSFNSSYLDNLFVTYSTAVGLSKQITKTEIDGYTSWVMLTNFDSVLRGNLGSSIFINSTLPAFNPESATGNLDRVKYSLTKAKASNMNKSWRTSEDIDVSDEISNVVQVLINNIPFKGSDRNIRFNEFGYIIGKLKDLSYHINPTANQVEFNDDLYVKDILNGEYIKISDRTRNLVEGDTFFKILNSIQTSAQEYIPAIFEILSNDDLRGKLKELIQADYQLSDFDVNLIKSLYDGLFNPDSKTSLLYANDVSSYDAQNYMGYITQACDGISNARYIQYFRDSDGNIYARNLYDQTLDGIQSDIENNILISNSRDIKPFDFEHFHEFSVETKKDEDGNESIVSIRFRINGNKEYIVYPNNNNEIVTNDGVRTSLDKADFDDVKNIVQEVLHQNFDTNDEYYKSLLIAYNQQEGTALQDLLTLSGNAVLNLYISNKLLIDSNKNPIYNTREIHDVLKNIYGEISRGKLTSKAPKYNKSLGQIYLTSQYDYPILSKLALAKALYTGRITSSQVRDGSGNALPSTSLSRLLGNILQQYYTKGLTVDSVVNNVALFKPGVLQGVFQAKEFNNKQQNTSTAHTEFNAAEIEQSQLFYDFLLGLQPKINSRTPIGDGKIGILPSVNSDKSNIGRIIVDLNRILINGQSLYKCLVDTFGNVRENAEEVLDQFIYDELGNNNGVYTKIIANINAKWDKTQQAINEYLTQFNSPYSNIAGETTGSIMDKLNQVYIKSDRTIQKPAAFLNDVTRWWNNEHPNDIIELTEHSTYEVDKSSGILLQNILLNTMKSRLSSTTSIHSFFNRQNGKLLRDLLKDNFDGGGKIYIGLVDLSSGNKIVVHNINDLYLNLNKINTAFKSTLTTSSSLDDILNTLGGNITLNPLISIYNKLNYIFSQEWMISNVGGHFNHPAKASIDTTLFRTVPLSASELSELDNLTKVNKQNNIRLAQLYRQYGYDDNAFKEAVIDKVRKVNSKFGNTRKAFGEDAVNKFLQKRHDAEILDEAGRFNSQTKRNVSYTAAMHPYQLKSLQGTPDVANVVVMKQPSTKVYTVNGDYTDACISDGGTFINPWMAYWENGALGSEKVGINKKQYIHFYKQDTGTGGVIKTAGFAMTNELMRLSPWQRRMTRMMADRAWRDEQGNTIFLDVTKDYNNNQILLQNNNDIQGSFFIKVGNDYYKFLQLNYKGKGRYTRTLQKIDPETLTGKETKEYDLKGKVVTDTNAGTVIDSNYKLWQMLGGYECYEQKSGMNRLTHSEYSIKAVADIANRVGIKKVPEGTTVRTQSDLYQVMKHSDFHYVCDEGSVKYGPAGVDDLTPYLNGSKPIEDFKPNFMHVPMEQSGIQLDKEHNADQESLSIFTQVISACAARGYTADKAQNLYKSLAALAYNATKEYQEVFDQFLENPNVYRDSFQETIANLCAKALMNEKNTSDVLNYVVSNLINLAKQGERFKFKDSIPFSDNSIYNKLISTIGSTLTKSAIKVKLPGLLAVLCPSSGIVKLYGDRLLSSYKPGELEALQVEKNNNPNWTITDGTITPTQLSRTYTLTVNPGHEESISNVLGITPNSNTIDFTLYTPVEREKLKQLIAQGDITSIVENVMVGRDLSAYDVFFKGTDADGNTQQYSLYDCDVIKQRFADKESVSDENLQYLLNVLSPSSQAYDVGDNAVTINGHDIIIDRSSIQVKPYELVIPKVFATNFGLDFDTDLHAILQDPQYFTKRLASKIADTIDDSYYSVAFTSLGGDPVYVLDRNKAKSSDNFKRIDVNTAVDKDGNVDILDDNFNKVLTLSKNQNDIEQDPDLHQDEVWQYIDGQGLTHNVIVTDDLAYYANNTKCNGIKVGEKNYDDSTEDLLKNSKNKTVQNWYWTIAKSGSITAKSTFKDSVRAFNALLRNVTKEGYTSNNLRNSSIISNLADQGTEIWESFKKSLDVVAARIPAQSLQSVMAMKVAGFIDSDVNTAYVSTLQTFLQGSDYDIDVVSLAMYAFDKQGKFVQWSPYFNLSSADTLQASLQLPFPTGKILTSTDVRFDQRNPNNIMYYISTSNNPDDSKPFVLYRGQDGSPKIKYNLDNPTNILTLAGFLDYINNYGFVFNSGGLSEKTYGQVADLLLPIINNHNNYINTVRDSRTKEDMIKNSIQQAIFDIILDPKNQREAQTSVDTATKLAKSVANGKTEIASPENEEAIRNTPGAFTTNIYGFTSNQVGKKAIGIAAATGLKAYFTLTQYCNNLLKQGNENALKRLRFDVEIGGEEYHTLSNIYTDKPNSFAEELINLAKNDQDFALQISVMESLSTDNAKELCLSKLNCTTDTMGLWLYGLAIGMDFKDIAKIMMSPTAFSLANTMRGNVFNGDTAVSINRLGSYVNDGPQSSTAQKIIKKIIGVKYDFSKPLYENFKNHLGTQEDSEDTDTEILNLLQADLNSVSASDGKGITHQEYLDYAKGVDEIVQWLRLYREVNNNHRVYEDFMQLAKGASEMLQLSQILHLNQGLFNSDTDILAFIDKFSNLINDRRYQNNPKEIIPKESKVTIDLHQFVTNPKYRNDIINAYEDVKVSFNILDVLANMPTYFQYLKTLDLQHAMNYNISSKYRAMTDIGKRAVNYVGAHSAKDVQKVYKRVSNYIDIYTAAKWMLESDYNPAQYGDHGINIYLPIGAYYYIQDVSNNNIITKRRVVKGEREDIFGEKHIVNSLHGMPVNLGTANGRASFKHWMESTVIPNLQKGSNGKRGANNKYIINPNSPLRSNLFIQRLGVNQFTKTPMGNPILGYALDINMSPRTDHEIELLYLYKQQFNKLKTYGEYSKYYTGTHSYDLTELFFLYNLCTYQNKLGENTLTTIFQDSRDWGIIGDYYKYINTMDRSRDVIAPEISDIVQYIAPIANKYSTKLKNFLSVDSITGDVVVMTRKTKADIEVEQEYTDQDAKIDPFRVTPLTRDVNYPTLESLNKVINIPILDKSEDSDVKLKNIPKSNQSYEDESGNVIDIRNIKIEHTNGSILKIFVNDKQVKIPNEYLKYFTHIPTKLQYFGKLPKAVNDYGTLVDDIVTLISRVC